MYILMSCYLEP